MSLNAIYKTQQGFVKLKHNPNVITDGDAWLAYPSLRPWFNKLSLALKQNITAFPVGVDCPKRGTYICRPAYNLLGMGRGAEIVELRKDQSTDAWPLGHFFQPWLKGDVICIEAQNRIDTSIAVGLRDKLEFTKWRFSYEHGNNAMDILNTRLPMLAQKLNIMIKPPEYVCFEKINTTIIDVHFRLNPDARYRADVLIPRSEKAGLPNEEGYGFEWVDDCDHTRAGFWMGHKS